ncbi:ATP-binding protein [Lachnospiraceae bacterium ZAX-1]
MNNMFVIAAAHLEYSFFTAIGAIVLLFMNITIFLVYDRFAQYTEVNKRNLIYEQQLELCSQNAAERQAKDQEIRKLRHNMKEHLTSLHGMATKGDTSSISKYIENLMPLSSQYCPDDLSRTGNIVVDSLINYKCSIAKSEGVSIKGKVLVPVELPFQGGHISIILGNLLENSLEACKDVDENKRLIEINLLYEKNMLFITVKNSFTGKRKQTSDGTFMTTKRNSKSHGIGLLSVRDAVKQYDGELTTTCSDGVFCATVILFGAEENF